MARPRIQVMRGECWAAYGADSRSSRRDGHATYIWWRYYGFRVVRVQSAPADTSRDVAARHKDQVKHG